MPMKNIISFKNFTRVSNKVTVLMLLCMIAILAPVNNYAQVNRANAKRASLYRASYQRMVASKAGNLTFEIRGGTLWGWGNNSIGQLGDGTTIQRPYAVQIGTDNKWVSVSAGASSNLGLKSDGTLWGWGANTHGEVGDGTTTIRTSPVQIGTDTKWVSIASDYYHSVALKSDGTLWAWGYNANGELGDGTTTQRTSPVQIGTDTKWTSISAGESFNLALKSDGTLWAWGDNSEAQIGDGTFTQRNSPVQIGTDTKWVSVSAGQIFSLALKSDGTLWAWGNNDLGELGDGTITRRTSPVQIGSDSKWVNISAGGLFSLGLKSDGTLWAWGQNLYGQLGDGTTTQKNSPVQIGSENKWIGISAGVDYSLGQKSDGSLWAWGANGWGQLGDLTSIDKSSPIKINTESKWVTVQGGNYHTIGLKTDGSLWAWGQAANGELGTGGMNFNNPVPVQVGNDNKWVAIACGGNHNLGLKSDGTLWAWGFNGSGQLGDGSTVLKSIPVQVGTDNDWANIATGFNHSVALKSNGTLWAWGSNSNAQVGDGTTTNRTSPVQIGSDNKWVNIKAGSRFSIAIKSDGTLWAWGVNDVGQLGDGTTVQKASPVQIGIDNKWVNISLGQNHTMGIKSDGTLWAWGSNTSRQLGDGIPTNRSSPIQIGTDTKWINIQAGQNYSIGLKSDGTFWSWGDNTFGALGDGTNTVRATPGQVGTETKWVNINTGGYHSIGLKSDRAQYCATGMNVAGQLGDNTTVDKNSFICNSICASLTTSINIDASSASICAGESVTFYALPFYGGPSPAFQWKKNGTNVGTNSNQYTDASLTNGDIITCVVTSNDPCVTTTVATSNSIAVTVTPLLTATVTNNGPICYGNTAVFTFTGTSGATAYYDIDGVPGSILLAGGTATISIANVTSNKTLTLGSASGGACPQVLNVTSTITVNPLASIGVSVSPSLPLCEGTTVTLSGTGATTYTWNNGVTNGVAFVPVYTPLFATAVNFTPGLHPQAAAGGDIDGDGKTDVVVANYNLNLISVFRNTSSTGIIDANSLSAKIDFAAGSGSNHVVTGDLDGDGEIDIIVSNQFSNNISVYRNTSTSGNISLSAKIDFATGNSAQGLAIGDIDGDGKKDIVVTNRLDNTISVFRNTSSPGSISFAAKINFTTGTGPSSAEVSDIDGDGKIDILVTNYNINTMSVFRNTSSSGSISLAAKVDFTTGTSPNSVATGDIDGDGKTDVVVTNLSSNTISIFRNTSTAGNITLTAKVDFATISSGPVNMAIGDLDGDGKNDIAVSSYYSTLSPVFINTSSPGIINSSSLYKTVDLYTGGGAWGISLADIDTDGKKELLIANSDLSSLMVYRNQNNPYSVTGINVNGCSGTKAISLIINPAPVILSQPPVNTQSVCINGTTDYVYVSASQVSGTITGYQWYSNAAPVNSGGNQIIGANSQFYLPTSAVAGTLYYYCVITNSNGCSVTSNVSGAVIINPLPTIGYIISPSSTVCAGTAVTLNGTGGISYTWNNGVSNGIPFTASATTTYMVTGTDVNGCTNTSNATVTVNPLPSVPSITADGPLTFCAGGSVNLTAPTPAGNALSFDGVDDYVSTNLSLSNYTNFTLEGWVLYNSLNGRMGIFGQDGAIEVGFISNSVIECWTPSGASLDWTFNNTTLPIGQWNHLAVVGNGSTIKLYVNGNLFMTSSFTTSNYGASTGMFNLGGAVFDPLAIAIPFNGKLDEVRVWNVARTASQIQSSFTSSVPANATGLVAYYKFDETSGSTCADATGNGNTGTLNNGPTRVTPSTITFFGTDNYLWSTGATTQGINVSATGSYNVSLINSFGCISTSNPVTVTVNPLPTVSFSGLSSSYCVSATPVSLTGIPSGGIFSGTGITGNVFSPATAGAGTYIITYTYSNPNGCVNSATQSVTVNALPTVTVNASPNTICSGNTTTLTANGAATYTWMPGSLSGASINVSPVTTTTYTVAGVSAAGCEVAVNNSWVNISGGSQHSVAIKSDGTLWAWGWNLYGQLGNGSNNDSNIPVQIGSSSNWTKVSAGWGYNLAIKSDGTLWSWGYNANGQLGDGSTVDKNIPVQIGTATNWASISAGNSHSLGIKTDGTLWAWGRNSAGQLGDGTTTQRNFPVQIGSATNWANVTTGDFHTLATKTDGTLWAWGANSSRQLGDGTFTNRNTPVQIGTATNWASISGGFGNSLAIKQNGTLWAWGLNDYGQLGDGTNINKSTPVQIGVSTNWSDVTAGAYHSQAIKTDGTLWGWGDNEQGQSGDGTLTNSNVPVQIGASSNWSIVAAGGLHTLGIKTGGSLWGWGYNPYGQIGDGTITDKSSPVQAGVAGISVTVTVNPLPTVSFSGLVASYCTTDAPVTLTGTPAGGTFSGSGVSGDSFDPAAAGAGGPYTITYSYTNENGCTGSSSQQVNVTACATTQLDLNLFLEGFYTGFSTMAANLYDVAVSNDPTAADYITVNLWNPFSLSNPVPDYSITTLLHTNGTASMLFPPAVTGNSFYIAVKHRNSIETWSHDPVLFSPVTFYDFSSGLETAYNDGAIAPMKNLGDGHFAFYAGDINQDGAIDAQDMNVIDNEIGFFGYNISDVNGDGATDAQDMNFVDNNSQLGLFFARPY